MERTIASFTIMKDDSRKKEKKNSSMKQSKEREKNIKNSGQNKR